MSGFGFSVLRRSRRFLAAAAFSLVTAVSGCDDDNSGPGPSQTFDQFQRLGNPLVSEVLLAKSTHPLHGSIGPDQDAALIQPELISFLTDVAGRTANYASTAAGVVTPDMLIVQTDKNVTSAGWLNWALSDGWGGRKLDDDVVDLALTAVFGSVLGDAEHATPALTTDNVGPDSPITTTFPYVAAPN